MKKLNYIIFTFTISFCLSFISFGFFPITFEVYLISYLVWINIITLLQISHNRFELNNWYKLYQFDVTNYTSYHLKTSIGKGTGYYNGKNWQVYIISDKQKLFSSKLKNKHIYYIKKYF